MQKFLALLLLFCLINGQENVQEEKTGSRDRLEEGTNAAIENKALKQFDECDAKDKTECFETAMKDLERSTDSLTRAIAPLAQDIIECKKSDNISECISNLSKKVELEEAKEQLEFIADIVKVQQEMLEEEKKIKEEVKKFEEENLICTTVDGEKTCEPNEEFAAIIKKENEKIEQELARIEEEHKNFIANNFTCDEDGDNCEPTEEYLAKKEADFLKYNNVEKIEVEGTEGEKQIVDYVLGPSEIAFEETLDALQKDLDNATDENTKKYYEGQIEAIKIQQKAAPKKLTDEQIEGVKALFNGAN